MPFRPSIFATILAACFAALVLAGCGEREPGPIADLETRGNLIVARSINERWFEVTESRDAGRTWKLLSPERYGSDDPNDPRFSLDDPVLELEQNLGICDGDDCWKATGTGIEASRDGGQTWQQGFEIPEGRERFAPTDYPTIVDIEIVKSNGVNVVVAATAENGLIVGNADNTWDRRSIDHWQAPDLTGNWVKVWPEITAMVIATAIVFALLLLLVNTLTRRAHEQIGQSFLSIVAVGLVAPIAYYSTLPILDWSDGTIVARDDAIDTAIASGLAWTALAAVVVALLSLALRYRWSRKLGSAPFPNTPA